MQIDLAVGILTRRNGQLLTRHITTIDLANSKVLHCASIVNLLEIRQPLVFITIDSGSYSQYHY